MWSMRKYAALPPVTTREEARKRENDYIIYGAMQALALGTFCLVAIYSAPDSFRRDRRLSA